MYRITIFIIITLLNSNNCLNIDSNLHVPQSFAFLTVTHTRGNDNSQFMKFLNRYATMECSIVSEINIVWNNEKDMEELGIFEGKANWKRPVYFYKTPFNSMDWRYKIPEQSKAEVYFSIDDDVYVNCSELEKSFQVWQSMAIGSMAPILSYALKSFELSHEKGFVYSPVPIHGFYSMGITSSAYLSRHFLELYYGDSWEIEQMRKVVKTKNNCDDIAICYLVNYYYPEFVQRPHSGDLQNISPAIAQATQPSHYPKRSQCIPQFIKIFGRSLPYIPTEDFNIYKRNLTLIQENVLIKKLYLETYVIKKYSEQIFISKLAKLLENYHQKIFKLDNSTLISPVIKNSSSSFEEKIKKLEEELIIISNQKLFLKSDLKIYKQLYQNDSKRQKAQIFQGIQQIHQILLMILVIVTIYLIVKWYLNNKKDSDIKKKEMQMGIEEVQPLKEKR